MGAPTGDESREGAKRGENYIPWEQIEPLTKPGMTGEEIGLKLLGALGLGQDYALRLMPESRGLPIREGFRYGVVVMKKAECVALYRDRSFEVF